MLLVLANRVTVGRIERIEKIQHPTRVLIPVHNVRFHLVCHQVFKLVVGKKLTVLVLMLVRMIFTIRS